VTRALATAALGVAICLAGATFDTASLYVPGLVLAGLALGALAWVRLAARGARVVRVPCPHSVVEEEPWPLALELCRGLLPPPGGELWEPLLGRPVRLAGRSPGRVRVSVRFARRGRRRLEPPLLVVRDPLGLDEVRLPGAGGEELLVLPRVEPVVAVRAGGAAAGPLGGTGEHGGAGRQLAIAAAEQEIDGLRPYREGTPAARIHWPTVARRGEMLERRLVADLDSAPLVVLDSSRPASEEALDAAVRAAGSLCLQLARRGGAAILLPGERRPTDVGPELGAWPTVHARLALVEPGSTPPAVGRAPRGGAVLWVSAAALQRPPTALERLPAASRWLVTPAPLAGAAAVFTVAGCTGQRLDRMRRPGRRAA
jgi:uncharacterized protein (DUF58 family)